LRHGLAFDSKNGMHQTYYDVDRNRLVYLYPNRLQWAGKTQHTRLGEHSRFIADFTEQIGHHPVV